MDKKTIGYLASAALSVTALGLVLALSHRPTHNFLQRDLRISEAVAGEISETLDAAIESRRAGLAEVHVSPPIFQEGVAAKKRALEDVSRIAPVPEPSGVAVLGLGCAVLFRRRPVR